MEYAVARDCMKVIVDFIEKSNNECEVTFLYIDDACTLDLQYCGSNHDFGLKLAIATNTELGDLIRKTALCEPYPGCKDYIFVHVGDACMRFLTVRESGSRTYSDGLYFKYDVMTGECDLYELYGSTYCAWEKKPLNCDHQIFGSILSLISYCFHASSAREEVELRSQAMKAIEQICLG